MTRPLARAAVACVCLLLPIAAASAEAPTLVPGDRGTALTVLEGGEIEEIPLRYIGTYHDFAGPGYDLHLVELVGSRVEPIGVAGGMSGSPVFIGGQLIGALSYRLGLLPTDAIAGVTPIADVRSASRSSRSIDVAGASDGIRPIATPVIASGLHADLRDWLAPELESMGLLLSGGGAAGDAVEPRPLEPGSPVGVELVRGDMSIAATGTVTWVEDDRVYAFGHPFLGAGRIEMPMVSAEVIHTLRDLAGSSKLANVGGEIGAFTEDRQAAIVGRLGARAAMIPLRVVVRGGDYEEQTFNYEFVHHSRLAPLLAALSVSNTLRVNNGFSEASTMLLRGTLRLRDLPDLPIELAFAGTGASEPTLAVVTSLYSALNGIWTNPFEQVAVEGLEIEVDVRREIASYRVESVHYDRGKLEPGELLDVLCVLRAYRGETVERSLSIRLPEKLPRSGSLVLAVGNPDAIDKVLGGPIARRVRTAMDAASIVEALAERRPAHELTAVVYTSAPALVARGLDFAELPPTAAHLISRHAGPGGRARGGGPTTIARTRLAMDGPVAGGKQLRLRVDRAPGEERP